MVLDPSTLQFNASKVNHLGSSTGDFMLNQNDKSFHTIAKNIDYALRVHQAKYVLVGSDCSGEGKSMFLSECAPVLAELYKKKILIFDCQAERDDVLEQKMVHTKSNSQFIRPTETRGLDYLHNDDLSFIGSLPDAEKASALMTHFNEISRNYDLIFINMKTLKRAEKTLLPVLPIDGAILVRSSKSPKENERYITNELKDREIPIIGLVMNEGV